jgi:hypothetical protein
LWRHLGGQGLLLIGTFIVDALAFRPNRMGHLKQPALSAGHRHLFDYPTPPLLDGLWGFGSLVGIGLQVQIVTGIVLAMHYTPHVVCAGVSIEHILREVYGGWMLRHAHANGASLFFIAVSPTLYAPLLSWPPSLRVLYAPYFVLPSAWPPTSSLMARNLLCFCRAWPRV